MVIARPDGSLPMSIASENTALYALAGNLSLPPNLDQNLRSDRDVWDYKGPFSDGNEYGVKGWRALLPQASGTDNTVTVDLSPLGGQPLTAIRYAVGGSECWSGGGDPSPPGGRVCARVCTGPFQDCALQPCLTDSCPIHASAAAGNGALQLPAAPFVANMKVSQTIPATLRPTLSHPSPRPNSGPNPQTPAPPQSRRQVPVPCAAGLRRVAGKI